MNTINLFSCLTTFLTKGAVQALNAPPATVVDIESKYISLKSGNHLDTCQMETLKESYDPVNVVFRDNPPSDSLPDNVALGVKKQLDLVVMRSL